MTYTYCPHDLHWEMGLIWMNDQNWDDCMCDVQESAVVLSGMWENYHSLEIDLSIMPGGILLGGDKNQD